jgi:hypothetical protein
MVANVDVEAPDGSRNSVELENSEGWLQTRVETSQAGLYRTHIRVSAQNHATEIYDIDLGSFSMLGVYREPLVAESVVPEVKATAPTMPKTEADKGTDWRMVGIIVVAVNVCLMLLILVGWLFLRRRKASEELIIEDDELSA